jgi:3D (Asp-Asp-Asp) domain-containing protein
LRFIRLRRGRGKSMKHLKKIILAGCFLVVSVFLVLACARVAILIEETRLMKEIIQAQDMLIKDLMQRKETEIVRINQGQRDKETKAQSVVNAVVTAYSPHKRQTDKDPHVAASMRKVREGTVAVSRDLFWQGWTFGRKVYIEGHGVFEINDLMNERYEKRIDVFRWSKDKAKEFGATERRVALLE